MALKDTFVKNIKATGTLAGEKHADGQGLYLHVKEAGKYWRMSYRFNGKQKTLALGVYRLENTDTKTNRAGPGRLLSLDDRTSKPTGKAKRHKLGFSGS